MPRPTPLQTLPTGREVGGREPQVNRGSGVPPEAGLGGAGGKGRRGWGGRLTQKGGTLWLPGYNKRVTWQK